MARLPAALALAFLLLMPASLAHDDTPPGSAAKPSGRYVGAAESVPMTGVIINYGMCDFEVVTGEPYIDGSANPGGTAQEGSWDDGGHGGAICHTPNDHYVNPDHNSPGCDYEDAYATDDVASDVWIIVFCDSITVVGGPGGPVAFTCGADGIYDDQNEGWGSAGVAYPAVAADCSDDDGAAGVLVVRALVSADPANPLISEPSAGTVW